MIKSRRKNYFINKKFQSSFFMKFAILLFMEAVLISGLFMFISRGTLTTAYRGAELTIQKTGAYFLLDFAVIAVMAGLGIGIAGVFVFMYLTHRIGGPLYKFEKTLTEATRGDVAQRMRLRETDQLLDLAARINAFLQETDSRVSGIKNDINKVLDRIEKDPSDQKKIKELVLKMKSSLEYFKTSK